MGVIEIAKHHDAPIVAIKNVGNDLKEGGIYYRYVGETRLIKPGELRRIIAARERRAVEEFARSMARVATGSTATLDLDSGKVQGTNSSFVVDKELLKQIQFIREGEFTETQGAPALRLIGEVTAIGGTGAERTRIVRQNVTPDAVLRNFLENEGVAEPLHYILSLAHANREWLPLWYYVQASRLDVDKIILALRAEPASQPSHRDTAIQRLLRLKSAFKVPVGTPKNLLTKFRAGQIAEPQSDTEDSAFALAVQGLPEGQSNLKRFRRILLSCLDRAQGSDAKAGNRRSSIYRAACRLDELLYRPAAETNP